MLKRLLVFTCILGFSVTAAYSAIYTVNPDGSGDAPTIQAAIDLTVNGDMVLINGGTYYETGLLVDSKNIIIQYGDGIPVLESSTPGSGICITLRNVDSGCWIWGVDFTGFETGILIENGSPMISFLNIFNCTTGVRITGVTSAPEISFDLIDNCVTGIDVQQSTNTVIQNVTIVEGLTGVRVSGGTVTVGSSILYRLDIGMDYHSGTIILSCNDLWENTVNYSGCSQGATDFFELPRFCYELDGSPGLYYLHSDSPCWASNNACGVNIGAYVSGPGCTGVAAGEATWGDIKQLYTE